MKNLFLLVVTALMLSSQAMAKEPLVEAYPFHSPEIKQNMARMLGLLIVMEESIYKDKVGYQMVDIKAEELNPDWEKLAGYSLELRQVIRQVGNIKDKNIYPDLVKSLNKKLDAFDLAVSRKNKNIYKSLDNLSASCMNCHSAHKP